MVKYILVLLFILGVAGYASADQEFFIEVDKHVAVRVQGASQPIVVETVRVRPKGSLTTEHQRVIRQGNKTIMVIRPYRNSGEIIND